MTKKQQNMIETYIRRMKWGPKELLDVYKKPSSRKISAYAIIHAAYTSCKEAVSGSFTLTGASTCQFSVAYIKQEDNKYFLIYHTACNMFHIPLDEKHIEQLKVLGVIKG